MSGPIDAAISEVFRACRQLLREGDLKDRLDNLRSAIRQLDQAEARDTRRSLTLAYQFVQAQAQAQAQATAPTAVPESTPHGPEGQPFYDAYLKGIEEGS